MAVSNCTHEGGILFDSRPNLCLVSDFVSGEVVQMCTAGYIFIPDDI